MSTQEQNRDSTTMYQPTQSSLWFGFTFAAVFTIFLAVAYPTVVFYYFLQYGLKSSLGGTLSLIVLLPVWMYTLYKSSLMSLVLYSWARENKMIRKQK